jgi:hypothetical protein
MYSPKINEELIPKIYEIVKKKGIKMTKLVNDILEKAVNGSEEKEELIKDISQVGQKIRDWNFKRIGLVCYTDSF